MSAKSLAGLVGVLSLVGASFAIAQQATAPAAGGAPAAQKAPGYVPPPENAGGRYAMNGEPFYKQRCASCHDTGADRAPPKADLVLRAPEDIYDALKTGVMAPMAQGLDENQIYGIVYYLTGKAPTPRTAQGPDANLCATHGPINFKGPIFNGWSNGVEGHRYQANPGLKAADVPRLKVKWTFSYPGTKNSQATVIGDRIFVASMGGKVYSLDAKTGCVHWRVDNQGGSRASMTVAAHKGAPSGYALYYGDDRMVLHAVDAGSGKELWKSQIETHKMGRITGSPTLYNGVLYTPTSSAEENMASMAEYECCTFRGAVIATDAATGKTLWKSYAISQAPKQTRKSPAGTQMWGPSGAAIWSAPTIDAKRGQLYVATGDSYTEVAEDGSDAIVAMDLKTGKIKWINQVLKNDNFLSGCSSRPGATRAVNCPLGEIGPDFDFGSSPTLMKAGGKDLVVTGNKSSIVYGMDPDTGKIVWETKLGRGGALGGVEFGTATDGKLFYAPVADGGGEGAKPGLNALDPATGKLVWHTPAPKNVPCKVPSGRCASGFSQAATAIPGAVFSGAMDGRLRAYNPADGAQIWEFDTTSQPWQTVNGVKDAVGGSLDYSGPTIAGGMVFVHSGYNGNAGANSVLFALSVDGK